MTRWTNIINLIKNSREKGYVIEPDDVGAWLGFDFGNIKKSDVGRRCWWRNDIIVMQSKEQAEADHVV